jgi:hypothetical protein
MSERVEARARRAPFLWLSSAAFRTLILDLPEGQRQTVGWVYTCLAATACDAFDGDHRGFVATREGPLVTPPNARAGRWGKKKKASP